jgi:hypothetical protein
MIRNIMLAVAVLTGLSCAIVATAGVLATPAAACDGNHTS